MANKEHVDRIVINFLVLKHRQLTTNIDHLEKMYPGVSHLNTKVGKPLKHKWQQLVHQRYCIDRVLTELYNYEDYQYNLLEIEEADIEANRELEKMIKKELEAAE